MRAGKKHRCPAPYLPYVESSRRAFDGVEANGKEEEGRDRGQDAGACSDHGVDWKGVTFTREWEC